MSQLLPIQDLISPKPEPKLTPSLVPAFRANAREMVETYVFTDTIRAHFDAILEPVATGHGQAFWVQAESGAGKPHFLVTLAALLANTADDTLWQLVQDGHIRQAQKRLRASRLFPVVLSLRGESAGDPYFGRSLLDVLLEEGFGNALEAANLLEEVQVTAADDILAWLEHTASPAIRADAEAFVNQQGNQTLAAYRDNEGTDAVAALLSQYFGSVGIRPDIASGQKERLGHIYRQLTDEDGPGYDGLLVLIDEYEGWEKGHNTPEELSRDTELLETLGSLLPVDLGYQVYTVVASQSAVPAKLQGSQAAHQPHAGDGRVHVAVKEAQVPLDLLAPCRSCRCCRHLNGAFQLKSVGEREGLAGREWDHGARLNAPRLAVFVSDVVVAPHQPVHLPFIHSYTSHAVPARSRASGLGQEDDAGPTVVVGTDQRDLD